jgi:hypothetical protein
VTAQSQRVLLGAPTKPHRIGRWPSRDPIEQEGGLHLYASLKNNEVNLVDPLGLFSLELHGHTRKWAWPWQYFDYPYEYRTMERTPQMRVDRCEIVLLIGHGNQDSFANTTISPGSCSAAGFVGCYLAQTNRRLPMGSAIPNLPDHAGTYFRLQVDELERQMVNSINTRARELLNQNRCKCPRITVYIVDALDGQVRRYYVTQGGGISAEKVVQTFVNHSLVD